MTSDHSSLAHQNASASISDLVSQATAQISTLVRDELTLAKIELIAKGKHAGIGGGLIGGAATMALYGVGLLLALAVVALDLVWPLWLAIAVVAVAVFAIAAVAALIGRRQLVAATPAMPSEAAAGIAADIQTVKDAVREGRQP